MSGQLTHIGKILSVTGNIVKVHVGESGEACGGCHVRFLCKPSGESGSDIDIPVKDGSVYSVGEHVRITMNDDKQYSATLFAMALPCVALGLGVAVGYASGLDEGLCALMGLGAVAVYFGILYLFRRRVNRKFTWNIEKTINNH